MKETKNLRKNVGLERAIEIAVSAHKGQVDKAGAPYIMHPLRVMMSLSTEAERIVGVLHDVVEDSDWTFDLLKEEGFEEEILAALASVTAIPGEEYADFIARASSNPIGKQVKIADLNDNMDMRRISDPTHRDFERLKKYSRSLAYLQSGNTSKFSA
jgi:(p)ppGpp synthase/HD superfamily hydrolase